jgi:hypothetical protein
LGKDKARRAKIFRALHAEAAKRKMDHDALRDLIHERTGVHSMADATTQQLYDLLHSWTGKGIKRTTPLPRKGCTAPEAPKQFVSGEDLDTLAEAFNRRGWAEETRRVFIRRQLRGRETIRTVADFHRVFSGVRAMNRRDEKSTAQEKGAKTNE